MTPRLLALSLLFLSGCTASWNRVVRYSSSPAPAGLSLTTAIYTTVLSSYVDRDEDPRFVIDNAHGTADDIELNRGTGRIPGHWADSLKRQVRAALDDPALANEADTVVIKAAAEELHLTPQTEAPASTGSRPVPRLWLSAPGFNADSTIAVVRGSFWCGPLCGSGEVLFLARRPGTAWRIWDSELLWVS